ncbi:MAG: hypothetical protein MUO58_13770, partial [Anaerolineales bacterium]|nr:hypothetical protein [Anaerolineales bacterium]
AMGIIVGVGFKGIGVGLGGGDVLVGPSLPALIVGSSVCDAVGCEFDEHADEQISTRLHKVRMRITNRRFVQPICSPLCPSLHSRAV